MSLHTDLPIYKTGCSLVGLAIQVQRQMPRDVKRSLGDRINAHCIEMLDLMALANASKARERQAYIERLLTCQRAAQVLLRVSHDQRFVSRGLWAESVQLLDSIGRQAGGWLKKTSPAKAPAA